MNPFLAVGLIFASWLVFSVVATVLWIIAIEVSERRSGRVRGQR